MPEIYKVAVPASYIRQNHPMVQEHYSSPVIELPMVQTIETTDGVKFLRFLTRMSNKPTEYTYIEYDLASEFIAELREHDPIPADVAVEGEAPEWPQPPDDVPQTGPDEGCGEGCRCYPEDEDEFVPVPWDYDAHTPFENVMRDIFTVGLNAILERRSPLMEIVVLGEDTEYRRHKIRRS